MSGLLKVGVEAGQLYQRQGERATRVLPSVTWRRFSAGRRIGCREEVEAEGGGTVFYRAQEAPKPVAGWSVRGRRSSLTALRHRCTMGLTIHHMNIPDMKGRAVW